MTLLKAAGVGAMLLALLLAPGTAGAAPFAAGPAVQASTADVTAVQYRGYGYRSYGYARPYAYARPYGRGYGYRPFIGFGVAAVAGAIIANEIYRPRPGSYYDAYDYRGPYYYPTSYQGDPRDICARHFRSFEWNTGLYTAYSGEKRLCPYLR